jgi:hypothetical protein
MTNEFRDGLMLAASFTVSGVAIGIAVWQHNFAIKSHRRQARNLLNLIYSDLCQLKMYKFNPQHEPIAKDLLQCWHMHKTIFAYGLDYESYRLLDSVCVSFVGELAWVDHARNNIEFQNRVLKAHELLRKKHRLKWIEVDG